jgi:hypothetical protein
MDENEYQASHHRKERYKEKLELMQKKKEKEAKSTATSGKKRKKNAKVFKLSIKDLEKVCNNSVSFLFFRNKGTRKW